MMDGIITTSVSKACFFVPGKNKSKSHKLKSCKLHQYSDDGNEFMRIERIAKSKHLWEDIESVVEEVHKDLQGKMFGDLLQFIQSHSKPSTKQCNGRRIEIPTAAIVSGVNMPDHEAIFSSLKSNIKEHVSPYVAMLQSKLCLNMKSLMKLLALQLASADREAHADDDDDDEDEDVLMLEKRSNAVTMSMIEQWYSKRVCGHVTSPSKRKKKKKTDDFARSNPIVILFQDLESFPQKLLHDFILTASFRAERVPLVFVLGVATSWSDVSDRLLSHSAIIHLSVRKFHAPSASSHLARVVDQVVLTSRFAFNLTGRCLQLLLDVFLCHDFSVRNFVRTLKFALLEHFRRQPVSILCDSSPAESRDTVSKLSKANLDRIRNLDSVKKYLSSRESTHDKRLPEDAHFETEVNRLVENFHRFHKCYFTALRCLYALCCDLPNSPLGKQMRELYCLCYNGDLQNLDAYKEAFLLLKVSSREQLTSRLTSCASVLDSHQPCEDDVEFSPADAARQLRHSLAVLEQIADTGDYFEDEDEENHEEQALEPVKFAYQLQERLRDRAKKKKDRRKSRFERLREEILDYIKLFFERNLRSPSTVPLHEVFFFDAVREIKQRRIAAPRLAVQTALSHPYRYLQVASLRSLADGVFDSSTPDVCVAYKLHCESGAIINLYDWLTAFHTVVTSSASRRADDCDADDVNEMTQARFIRAVSELQLLGFVKPSKRKTDHVQRLTWSCA